MKLRIMMMTRGIFSKAPRPSGWEGAGQSGREQGASFGGHLGQLKGITDNGSVDYFLHC